jgi:uncharacterized protein YcbK (DUF882 family)
MTVEEFVSIIQPIIHVHNGSVTSWIRSVKHNAEVGGAVNSRHILGLAVDVVLDEMTEDKKAAFMKDCRRYSLVPLDEGDHIHVQTV